MDICLYEEHYTQWKIKLQSLFLTQKGKITVHFYAKSTMKYAHVRWTVPETPPIGAAVPAGYDNKVCHPMGDLPGIISTRLLQSTGKLI